MCTFVLNEAEKALFKAIEHGDQARFRGGFEDRKIRAEVLRHFVLGLPVIEEDVGLLGAAAASLLGRSPEQKICQLTGVGISLKGAIVSGRLVLDSAIGESGGPLCPMEFNRCGFDGGFSGRHTHFSRLCFHGSRFHDPPPRDCAPPAPTIDLSDATIESSLSMRRIRPWREKSDAKWEAGYLWIRALGARINGEVDLSYSRLRAPPEPRDRPLSEPPIAGLDLSLARVNGDFQFLNGARSRGAIWARGAIIRGDVWMSAAEIEGGEKYALFFQSAEIGGCMMLDGRPKDAARRQDIQPFRAFGQLNLNDLQLGGTLILANVELFPPKLPEGEAHPLAEREEELQDRDDPAAFACLRLDEARIGDSVVIRIEEGERSRLHGQLYMPNLEVKNALTISDAFLGMPLAKPVEAVTINAPFLTARQVEISNVEPLLWEEEGEERHPDMKGLSIDLEGARIESLKVVDSWLNGCFSAPTLKCAGDLRLDASIGAGVDLRAAEIGGSLDISELRLDENARGLVLRDGTIGRTLKLTQTEVAGRDGNIRLVEARRVALSSLDTMALVECLWRRDCGGGRLLFLQTGFLFRGERAFLLDGKQATFDSIVGHFGHRITSPPAGTEAAPTPEADGAAVEDDPCSRAIEFGRLYCAYVRCELPRIMIASPEDVPLFLEPVPSAGGKPTRPPAVAEREPLKDIGAAELAPKAIALPGGKFIVTGHCFKGSTLLRMSFRLRTAVKPVKVKVLEQKPIRELGKIAVADGRLDCSEDEAERAGGTPWLSPPAVAGMAVVEDRELADLEARLVHHVRSSCTIRGTADLTGLTCGMLDDNSGRAWGTEATIQMNHFIYGRTTWVGRDAQDPASFRKDTLRGLRVAAARRVPQVLIDLFGLNEWLRRSSRYCTGWQARLNWIYRQFDVRSLPSPSRYPITQAEYTPQPFEQAIRVCRAEGREDYAIEFEIEKQRIEWRLFNRRTWPRFVIVGLAAAAIWLFSTRVDTPDRVPIALALAIGIAAISHLANFAMRIMFGYLRKPVRAIGSLVAAFLIGWAGVHLANERHLMVVDVAPVAGLAAGQEGETLRMAIQSAVGDKSPVENVHCDDTISSALYALDVLIPLIDLRQESRCEIGRARDFKSDRPLNPFWVRWVLGSAVDSERFWAAAKAIYAIAGWFIVSLSILTFAHTNRARVEP